MEIHVTLQYFQWYLVFMAAQWLVYARYFFVCIRQNTTRHRMFWAAYVCLVILSYELVRVWLIWNGVILPEPKSLIWFIAEHVSFGIVAYEICKKWGQSLVFLAFN